jgi:dolichyl-phosphate beta-glucosyltransferase
VSPVAHSVREGKYTTVNSRTDSVTIVIPAYNESKRLPPTLERVIAYAQRQPRRVDLLIVDDGSKDGTADLARQVVGDRMPLTVLVNEPNRGKGFSVRRGMLEATGDCVLFTDADLSTPIEELDGLLAEIEKGADIAIGSRAMPGSKIEVHQPWWRERAGRLFGFVTRTIALPGIYDSQCGFKCFRREAAQAIFPLQTLGGWAFDVEVLVIARKLGFCVAQVPVHWVNDPNSKVHMLSDGPKMVLDMIRARWKHRKLRALDASEVKKGT